MSSEDLDAARLQTEGGISYKLIDGFPKIGGTLDNITAEEEVVIRALDLPAFLLECIPRSNVLNKVKLPRKMPGLPHLSCVKFDAIPHDISRPADPYVADTTNTEADTYGSLVRVHLWYEAISRSFIRERNVGIGAEYLHIPPSNLFIAETPEATATAIVGAITNPVTGLGIVGANVVSVVNTIANTDNLLGAYKLVPTAEWTYKLQPFSNPAWTDIYYTHLGKVNQFAAASLCENAPVETVLFSGLSATEVFSNYNVPNNADGSVPRSWLIELRFSQRLIIESGYFYTWNHVYSPKLGKWTKLERAPKGSQKWLFESADLAKYLLDLTVVEE